jgi:acetyltransferase-like isoleucine patch superfamily enzyme
MVHEMGNSIFAKALRVLTTRPAHFIMNLRGYYLFRVTHFFAPLFFGAASGISLGRNVRIQKARCLSAERPDARISIGDHSVVYEHADIAAYGHAKISIGSHCIIGDVRIYARAGVTIGARNVFSWNVFIQDFLPHPTDPVQRAEQLIAMTDHFLPAFDGHQPSAPRSNFDFPAEPIELGDDLWFGAGCTILPGVKIGAGSIVAAGAVVTRGEYPARSILAGNPARVVKSLATPGTNA